MKSTRQLKRVCVCFLVCLTLLGVCICNWSWTFRCAVKIPLMKWLIAYNFPPSDFYTPLAEVPLTEGCHVLQFRGKYEGRHEVQITPIVDRTQWQCNVAMTVKILNSKGECVYKETRENQQLLGGVLVDGVMVYNYCYAIFETSTDFPVGDQMTAEITCTGDVSKILEQNPTAKIKILKVFDK